MTTRQESIRATGKGRIQYVMEQCQWQGGSTKDCKGGTTLIAVKSDFPIRFQGNVRVCDSHREAFIRQARKTGHLA